MTVHRLPIVNNDDGTWGDILRTYLLKEHYDDGTDNITENGGHKTVTIRPGTTGAGTAPLKLSSGGPMSAAETGAMEYATDTLYFTVSSNTRKRVALYPDAAGAIGDVLYRDSSGNFSNLTAVATGKSLRSGGAATAPAYADLAQVAAGSSQVVTKTASYTIMNGGANNDVVIFADNTTTPVTITLPLAASYPGYRFYIKRTDNVTSNACTIARSGSDTIDGATSWTLDLQYTAIAVVSNGSNWYIL